jgi:signal peptidase I
MKKLGMVMLNIVLIVWFIIALFTTACLLSYNDFRVTTFGNYSLVIVDSDELEPDYQEGSLLLVKKNGNSKINVDDKIFYYNTSKDNDTTINTDVITKKDDINKAESTFTLSDNQKVSSEFVLGTTKSTTVLPYLGTALGILTSKWGFMFIIIFPTLFMTLYELLMIIELFRSDSDEDEEDNKNERRDKKKE